MNFTVESGIPYVSKAGGRGRKPTAFPLSDMEVGDSFLIPCDTSSKKTLDSWRRKLLVAKKRFAESYGDGYNFRTVTVEDGLRVHRTEDSEAEAEAE